MPKAIDAAFAQEMEGRQYGTDETRDARDWFDKGWNNALAYAHSPQQAADMAELVKERNALQTKVDQFNGMLDLMGQMGEQARLGAGWVLMTASEHNGLMHKLGNVEKLEERLARVYDERNAMAISIARLALAAGYKAGWGTDNDENKKWDQYWRTVVYVQFDGVTPDELDAEHYPMQLSWHMPPDWQTAAQALLPAFDGHWDGSFLGRDPAKYVGQVPSVPHMSQITSVTLNLDAKGGRLDELMQALRTDMGGPPAVFRPSADVMYACTVKPSESFATMQQFGNQESDKPEAHDLWKDGDENIPRVICDANGQVVLGLCKKCGAAEDDLFDPCTGKKP